MIYLRLALNGTSLMVEHNLLAFGRLQLQIRRIHCDVCRHNQLLSLVSCDSERPDYCLEKLRHDLQRAIGLQVHSQLDRAEWMTTAGWPSVRVPRRSDALAYPRLDLRLAAAATQ